VLGGRPCIACTLHTLSGAAGPQRRMTASLNRSFSNSTAQLALSKNATAAFTDTVWRVMSRRRERMRSAGVQCTVRASPVFLAKRICHTHSRHTPVCHHPALRQGRDRCGQLCHREHSRSAGAAGAPAVALPHCGSASNALQQQRQWWQWQWCGSALWLNLKLKLNQVSFACMWR
jgi:hypothetical protein